MQKRKIFLLVGLIFFCLFMLLFIPNRNTFKNNTQLENMSYDVDVQTNMSDTYTHYLGETFTICSSDFAITKLTFRSFTYLSNNYIGEKNRIVIEGSLEGLGFVSEFPELAGISVRDRERIREDKLNVCVFVSDLNLFKQEMKSIQDHYLRWKIVAEDNNIKELEREIQVRITSMKNIHLSSGYDAPLRDNRQNIKAIFEVRDFNPYCVLRLTHIAVFHYHLSSYQPFTFHQA